MFRPFRLQDFRSCFFVEKGLYLCVIAKYHSVRNYLTIILGGAILMAPGLFQPASAQVSAPPKDVVKDSVTVFFKPSSSTLDLSWKDNAVALENFFSRVDAALEGTDAQLVKVQIWPGASPEGPAALNERLSKERKASILQCLRKRLSIADDACETEVRIVDWDRFRALVVADKAMPAALKEQTLKVLDQQPAQGDFKSRVGQQAWDYVHDHFFPALRSATTVLTWKVAEVPVPQPEPAPQQPEPEPEPQPEPKQQPEPEQPLVIVPPVVPYSVANYSTRDFLLKLNVLTLPALVLNGGVEFQVADHFSLGLNAYYSGWDYFDETRKLRTLTFQPEARYWFRSDLHGLFLGLHGTLGWYNVAWGGEYRYQDNRPSVGGGIDLGYKFRLGKDNSPWGLELGLGAGVLPLHYDRFFNVSNGRLASQGNRTLWGIDQAFVAFTYRFGQIKHPKK